MRGLVTADYRVTVLKRYTFQVRAATPDEARALALVVAAGDAPAHAIARTACLGRELTVLGCVEAAPGVAVVTAASPPPAAPRR